MCVPYFQILTGSLIYIWFPPPHTHSTLSFSFPPCPQARQTAPKAFGFVCVRVCMHASVNPFCQVLAQPFLSKLPAWSRSPLCWWEELEEKAFGTPAAPRPSPGPSAHEGRAWDLLYAGLCVAAVTDASIASPRDTPVQPCIPFHTSETGEKDNYTHIQQPPSHSLSTALHLWCPAISQI